ncbi:cyanate transporter [Xenorhabdus sp. PB30.3]|uniref:cyanate transporter n=1 Tax=Xenorhabdus sp. PB30.3 TaxID=2788941 RepID=UPI001E478AF5|nr:cyanate transporter [Xenorhabdus sp. PB30.3]MCC8380503.1 cyanate transporter [Xenorhabdus sp. PB30.3]
MNSSLRNNSFLLLIIFVLVGLNLRPSMAAIGPLLNSIRDAIPLSYTLVSLLTMLPVFAMGIAMFIGIRLADAIGEHRVVSVSLIFIALASFFRLYATDSINLLITAVVAGAGIAIIQAVIPKIIKSRFPNSIELYMGVYVTAIMGGAAVAASSSPFIAEYFTSWRVGLSIWAGVAIFALLVWLSAKKLISGNQPTENIKSVPEQQKTSFFKNRRAWLLGLFFGLGTSSYTCVLAWLPPYYFDLGWQDKESGLILAYLTLMEVISGLIIPIIASRSKDRRWILTFLLGCIVIGFIGLMLKPSEYALLWSGLLGIGIGGLFPMSLIVTMDHVSFPAKAGQLTAFVQGIGYILASLSPLLAGYIKDTYSSFSSAWAILATITCVMIFMAWRFKPAEYNLHFAE